MAAESLRPRRVLMTADAVGGVWTHVVELGSALARRGATVDVAVMGAPLRDDQRRQADDAGLAVLERPFRLEWMQDPWADVEAAGHWLLDVAARVSPDIVHLNGYAHGALAWPAPCVVVGHSCVLSWWEAVRGTAAPPSWDRYRAEVARGLGAADHVVAPTEAMLSALQRHYGALPPRSVVPNGRSAHRCPPAAKQPLVLGAGRLWDDAKNLAALEKAAARLPWPVYVAGEATSPEGHVTQPIHAHHVGRLDASAIAEWMGRAAIFAAPARYEPFGLAPLEAALAGCALVLGDIASLRETWGGRALFVPPDDPDALAAALRRLIGDSAARAALATAARTQALRLTPARMATGYLQVYARALAGRVSGTGHGARSRDTFTEGRS